MTSKKGERFQATYSKRMYVIVGQWCGNLVLAPMDKDDNECLIYSADEIKELVSTSQLIRKVGCPK